MTLDGLHHITMITGDARQNVAFYADLLGLRMVKKTVNFDSPDAYHLYFGDEAGTPGTLLTWFEFPGAAPARPRRGRDPHARAGRRERGGAGLLGRAPERARVPERARRRRAALRRLRRARARAGHRRPRERAAARRAPRDPRRARRHRAGRSARVRARPHRRRPAAHRRAGLHAARGRRIPARRRAPALPLGLRPGRPVAAVPAPAPSITSPGARPTRITSPGGSACAPRAITPPACATATTSARSTSASRGGSCSRSPRARPASPSTRRRSTSARSCGCPRCTRTCASGWSGCSRRSRTRAGQGAGLSALAFRERPADGEPAGLLVLHHGRGADEHDLLPLADVLDPERRLHVATPRAPLTLPGWPGRHWYVVPRVGYPDPDTFRAAHAALAAFHDDLWERTGVAPADTVFGGFSMGSVMSYALGLDGGRPAPAGILAFSGFIPTVEGWRPDPGSRPDLRAFIAHGRLDPVMEIGFARRARDLLEAAGLDVDYHESDAAHHIDPVHVPAAVAWVGRTLGARRPEYCADARAVVAVRRRLPDLPAQLRRLRRRRDRRPARDRRRGSTTWRRSASTSSGCRRSTRRRRTTTATTSATTRTSTRRSARSRTSTGCSPPCTSAG